MLRIYPITLEIAREVARIILALNRVDPDLARQLRRAVTSVPLNLGEGMYSQGKLRQARYHNALGSAREVLSCLEVAVAMGYIKQCPCQLEARLNRVIGTLVKLVSSMNSHGRSGVRSVRRRSRPTARAPAGAGAPSPPHSPPAPLTLPLHAAP